MAAVAGGPHYKSCSRSQRNTIVDTQCSKLTVTESLSPRRGGGGGGCGVGNSVRQGYQTVLNCGYIFPESPTIP